MRFPFGMRRRLIAAACALLVAKSACAFDPFLISAGVWLTEYVATPLAYVLGCAFAFSPPIRVCGTEQTVYGLDWGSLACHAENVYGLQLGFCGGSVEQRMCGLQLGILASGYAVENLPFDEYHFFDLDSNRLYGLQFGTFAAKSTTVNGFQLSAVYTQAEKVNGFQVGLVNVAGRLRGLQVGLFNTAERGCGLQVGVANVAGSGLAGVLPVVNFVY